MRAGINCALANRQILTHLARKAIAGFFPDAQLGLVYDVSHNTCLEEVHATDVVERRLHVHRKARPGRWDRDIPTCRRRSQRSASRC